MSGTTDQNYIFFFKSEKSQILFEFFYLLVTFFVCCILLIVIHLGVFSISNSSRWNLYAVIGGFMGGWTFDAKWFYKVTAMGKDNQKRWKWEAHKIYWRILTPFLSSIISFAIYALTVSNVIPFITLQSQSGLSAFGFSYIIGSFSDITYGKLSEWATVLWGNTTKEE